VPPTKLSSVPCSIMDKNLEVLSLKS